MIMMMKMKRNYKSMTELNEAGLFISEEGESIKINLETFMKSKNISAIEVCRKSGISRQAMNAILRGKMKPGLDFALKVAKCLQVSVEELFELTESAWEEIAKTTDDKTLFLDRINMEIVDGVEKREKEQDGFIYMDMMTNQVLTKPEYDKKWLEYIEKKTSSHSKKEMEKHFKAIYGERYVKLVKKITVPTE